MELGKFVSIGSCQCFELCPPKIAAVIKLTGDEMNEVEQLTEIVSVKERKSNGRSQKKIEPELV